MEAGMYFPILRENTGNRTLFLDITELTGAEIEFALSSFTRTELMRVIQTLAHFLKEVPE